MNPEPESFTQKPGNELLTRTISAIVMAGFVLAVTWSGGIAFNMMWACLFGLVMYEYARISGIKNNNPIQIACYVAFVLIVGIWVYDAGFVALSIAGLALVILGLGEFYRSRNVLTTAGLAYALLPFIGISSLRSGDDVAGLVVVLLLYAIVWGTDIFAYFAGRTFGGPKLAPSVSPKKTWSGFAGGIVGSVLLAWIVATLAGYRMSVGFVGVVIMLSIASQLGDLLESWLKRKHGVKDSGNIIPGHGGILDRIDGLITAAILMAAVSWMVSWLNSSNLSLAQTFINAFMLP